ncbi:hypothetical protein TNCV_2888551 [Trichonephila clavipes]|nr:hypothetical protein TNCV_2888551 [Trichonephila clavipes]
MNVRLKTFEIAMMQQINNSTMSGHKFVTMIVGFHYHSIAICDHACKRAYARSIWQGSKPLYFCGVEVRRVGYMLSVVLVP